MWRTRSLCLTTVRTSFAYTHYPLPKRLMLVRHGESMANVDRSTYHHTPDWRIPLTDLGKEQAADCGRRLQRLVRDDRLFIYYSPYRRATQTLEGIRPFLSEQQILGIREDERLREQEMGNYQPDVSSGEMDELWEDRNRYGRIYYRFPSGESGLDVFDRVGSFLGSLLKEGEVTVRRRQKQRDSQPPGTSAQSSSPPVTAAAAAASGTSSPASHHSSIITPVATRMYETCHIARHWKEADTITTTTTFTACPMDRSHSHVDISSSDIFMGESTAAESQAGSSGSCGLSSSTSSASGEGTVTTSSSSSKPSSEARGTLSGGSGISLHNGSDEDDYTVVVVAHGLLIRLFISRLFLIPTNEIELLQNPPNCSITVLQRDPSGLKLELTPISKKMFGVAFESEVNAGLG